jgi:protein disulfide-isomerase A1
MISQTEIFEVFHGFKLYPAGSKDSPVLYSGSRTPEDWAKFIRDNGTHKAELEFKSGASGG